jgi:hypothetical protein
MVRKLTQRERNERGKYCETLTKQVLEEQGFTIIRHFHGGESKTDKKAIGSCPDLVIKRPNSERLYKIEVKSGQTLELDSSKPIDPTLGVRPERPGRIQLVHGGSRRGVAAKDCYAISLDDAYSNARTLEFFAPDYMDDWLKKDIAGTITKSTNSSKFPLSFWREMRENQPCPINELKGKVWIMDKEGKELKRC